MNPGDPQPAPLDPDSAECAEFQPYYDRLQSSTVGHRAAYITAGVLAAGAIVAFFLERNDDPDATADVAFGVGPTDGGAEASMSIGF